MSVTAHAARPDTRRAMIFVAVAAAIVAANATLVSLYPGWEGQAAPEWPVAVDLLLVVPLLYLALNFRRGRAALWRAAAIAGFGVLAGAFIIPQESKQLWLVLEPLRHVLLGIVLLAQFAIVLWVVARIFRARHRENLELAIDREIATTLGRQGVANIVRLEARVWLYALLRQPIRQPFPGLRHFHVGAQGWNASNQQAFLVLIGAEIPVAHFIIALFDPLVAVIVSALSVYGFMFMLADYRASTQRPISADDEGLQIRYGVVTDCRVRWASIVRAERFKGTVRRRSGELRLTAMGAANVMLELAPDTRVAGLFGEQPMQRIYLGVDEPDAFVSECRVRIA